MIEHVRVLAACDKVFKTKSVDMRAQASRFCLLFSIHSLRTRLGRLHPIGRRSVFIVEEPDSPCCANALAFKVLALNNRPHTQTDSESLITSRDTIVRLAISIIEEPDSRFSANFCSRSSQCQKVGSTFLRTELVAKPRKRCAKL